MVENVYNGEDIAEFLTGCGCGCEFRARTFSPSSVVYFFDLINPMTTAAKMRAAVRAVALTIHKTAILTDGGKYNFAIAIPRESRCFPTFYDVANTGRISPKDGDIIFGIKEDGERLTANINSLPHLLISGASGSGKSVFMHSVIASLSCFSAPYKCDFIMIDMKGTELTPWHNSRRLIRPVITNAREAVQTLGDVEATMNNRYKKLIARGKIDNSAGDFPRLVVFIDELADLMLYQKKEATRFLTSIAQKGRAAGVHLILATQRPSVDVVTGLIKANIPARAVFSTTSAIDSMVMLGHKGAEQLKGKGDSLVKLPNGTEYHVQAPNFTAQMIYDVTHPRRTLPDIFN